MSHCPPVITVFDETIFLATASSSRILQLELSTAA
jgi:hypothetical protein